MQFKWQWPVKVTWRMLYPRDFENTVDSWALGVAADGGLDGAVSARGEAGRSFLVGAIREECGVFGGGAWAWV